MIDRKGKELIFVRCNKCKATLVETSPYYVELENGDIECLACHEDRELEEESAEQTDHGDSIWPK